MKIISFRKIAKNSLQWQRIKMFYSSGWHSLPHSSDCWANVHPPCHVTLVVRCGNLQCYLFSAGINHVINVYLCYHHHRYCHNHDHCGGLNKNGPHRPTGSDTIAIRKCDLARWSVSLGMSFEISPAQGTTPMSQSLPVTFRSRCRILGYLSSTMYTSLPPCAPPDDNGLNHWICKQAPSEYSPLWVIVSWCLSPAIEHWLRQPHFHLYSNHFGLSYEHSRCYIMRR